MTTILMTGARGNTGRLLGPLLARRGATVRGGSRTPATVDLPGVTPVAFDWDDPATWAPALDGVDALYVQRPEVEAAPALIAALIDAAPAAARVVLLSDDIHGADVPAGSWEGRVERAVAERGRALDAAAPELVPAGAERPALLRRRDPRRRRAGGPDRRRGDQLRRRTRHRRGRRRALCSTTATRDAPTT